MPEIPFAQQWEIVENQLMPLKDSVDDGLTSTRITNIPEFEYYMEIFPNGDDEKRRGKTWIFLCLQLKNIKKVEADFAVTIESANFSKANHYVYEESFGWGTFICSAQKLFDPENKFFVDGKLTVKINGIFKFESGNDAIPVAIEQKWIGGELGDEFWKKDDTKDFTIITSADGKEIKVHKSVLDVRSDVFEAMVKSNMKESKENKVAIPDFSFNVVETGIKLIYECNFDSALSMDELMQLLQFFDKYLLQTLKAKVEPYLISQISPSTAVRLTNCSILTNSFKLKKKCMEFLSAAFQSKTPLADIDNLDKDVLLEMFKNSFFGNLETETQ